MTTRRRRRDPPSFPVLDLKPALDARQVAHAYEIACGLLDLAGNYAAFRDPEHAEALFGELFTLLTL